MDFITRRAEHWFRTVVRAAIPRPADVHRWVEKLHAKNPGRTPEELARIAVAKTKWKVWLIAVVAGLFSNPLFCVLLAWIETKRLIKWQVEIAAKIAGIMDPEALNDQTAFETDLLAILMPQAVDEELELAARTSALMVGGAIATRVAQNATRIAIRRVIAKDVLKMVRRYALRVVGVKVTQRALLTKAVPLAGIVVGVVLNNWEINRTGASAIAFYRRQAAPEFVPQYGATDSGPQSFGRA